jgi:ketosteroid isomerase-like protein
MSDRPDSAAVTGPGESLASFLTTVQAGDFAAAAGYFSPEVVTHEPDGIITGGEHAGFAGWASMMTRFGQAYDLKVSSFEILESGDRAILMMAPAFTARATGRSAVIPVVEVYRFAGGLIADIDVFYKDPAALAGLLMP